MDRVGCWFVRSFISRYAVAWFCTGLRAALAAKGQKIAAATSLGPRPDNFMPCILLAVSRKLCGDINIIRSRVRAHNRAGRDPKEVNADAGLSIIWGVRGGWHPEAMGTRLWGLWVILKYLVQALKPKRGVFKRRGSPKTMKNIYCLLFMRASGYLGITCGNNKRNPAA